MKTRIKKYKKIGKGEYMVTNMSVGDSIFLDILKLIWMIFIEVPFKILWWIISLPFRLVIWIVKR